MPAVLFDPFDSTDAVVAWTKAHRIAMKVSVVKTASSTSANAATNVTTDVSPEPVILQMQNNGNDLEEQTRSLVDKKWAGQELPLRKDIIDRKTTSGNGQAIGAHRPTPFVQEEPGPAIAMEPIRTESSSTYVP
ncbi:hypothetical protein V8E54_007486 [Elaphomyces granulatus]